MIEVYFRLSSLRRNERGITTSLVYGQRSSDNVLPRNIHECSDPKMPVHQVCSTLRMSKSLNHTRHEVANDDQITDPDTEALDRNGCVEENSRIRVSDLTEGKETSRATIQVSCAASLKVQAESRGET